MYTSILRSMCFLSIGSKFGMSKIMKFSKNMIILFVLYCFPKYKAPSIVFGYRTLYKVFQPPPDSMRSRVKVKYHTGCHQGTVSLPRIATSFSWPRCQAASRQKQRNSTTYLASDTL